MDYQVVLSDLFISDLKEIVDYLAIRADGDKSTKGRIAELLGLHSGANVSQQVRRLDTLNPPDWSNRPAWKKWRKTVKIC